MKILMQTEARNMSNREIAENQAYLIDLFDLVGSFTSNLQASLTSSNKASATRKTRMN